MTQILDFAVTRDGLLGLDLSGGWEHYLTIAGERAYQVGVDCETCGFLFARLEGAREPPITTSLSRRLNSGLGQIDDEVIDEALPLLPAGQYTAALLRVNPTVVERGTPEDYFVDEFEQLWGAPGREVPLGLGHYYRARNEPLSDNARLFEFLLPMLDRDALDEMRIAEYVARIRAGNRPTALALSLLDVQQPHNWPTEVHVTEHWCFAHYLIDGHHKIEAAARAGASASLLSLLIHRRSAADPDKLRVARERLLMEATP